MNKNVGGEAKMSRVGLYAIENSHTTGASAMTRTTQIARRRSDQQQPIAIKHAGSFPA